MRRFGQKSKRRINLSRCIQKKLLRRHIDLVGCLVVFSYTETGTVYQEKTYQATHQIYVRSRRVLLGIPSLVSLIVRDFQSFKLDLTRSRVEQ